MWTRRPRPQRIRTLQTYCFLPPVSWLEEAARFRFDDAAAGRCAVARPSWTMRCSRRTRPPPYGIQRAKTTASLPLVAWWSSTSLPPADACSCHGPSARAPLYFQRRATLAPSQAAQSSWLRPWSMAVLSSRIRQAARAGCSLRAFVIWGRRPATQTRSPPTSIRSFRTLSEPLLSGRHNGVGVLRVGASRLPRGPGS